MNVLFKWIVLDWHAHLDCHNSETFLSIYKYLNNFSENLVQDEIKAAMAIFKGNNKCFIYCIFVSQLIPLEFSDFELRTV